MLGDKKQNNYDYGFKVRDVFNDHETKKKKKRFYTLKSYSICFTSIDHIASKQAAY